MFDLVDINSAFVLKKTLLVLLVNFAYFNCPPSLKAENIFCIFDRYLLLGC